MNHGLRHEDRGYPLQSMRAYDARRNIGSLSEGSDLTVVVGQTFPHSIVKKRDLALKKWVDEQKQSDAYPGRGEKRDGDVSFASEKKHQQKENDRRAQVPTATQQAEEQSDFLLDGFFLMISRRVGHFFLKNSKEQRQNQMDGSNIPKVHQVA